MLSAAAAREGKEGRILQNHVVINRQELVEGASRKGRPIPDEVLRVSGAAGPKQAQM